MKKLIILFTLLVAVLFIQAQTIGVVNTMVRDSTTNTETKYLDITTPVAINGNYVVSIGLNPTNKSGTATVTAALQFSYDNSIWFNYGSTTTINTAGTVGAFAWYIPDAPFKYYRMKCSSTGTGVTLIDGYFLLKRK